MQDCPLTMLLFVVATKVVTHDNNKGLKVIVQTGDQEFKIVNFGDNTNIFYSDIDCFSWLNPILILYGKVSSSKINFSKNPGIISY